MLKGPAGSWFPRKLGRTALGHPGFPAGALLVLGAVLGSWALYGAK